MEKSPNWDVRSKLKVLPGQFIAGFPFSEGTPNDPYIRCDIILRDGEKARATLDLSTQYRAEGIQWYTSDGRTFPKQVVAAWQTIF